MNEINEQLKKVFQAVHHVKLDKDEKSRMRDVLLRAVSESSIRSPYVTRVFMALSHSRVAGTVFAMVLMATGGLTYASAQALPGETLFSMKTDVTEKMEGFLILSEKSKAEFEVKLTKRRLEEATLLAKAGKLDAETQVTVAENIKEHVEKAGVHTDEMVKSAQLDAAQVITVDLENTLTTHSESLSDSLAPATATPDPTLLAVETVPIEIAPLLVEVRQQVQVAQEANSKIEVEIAARQEEVEIREFKDTEILDAINEDYFEGDFGYEEEQKIIGQEALFIEVPVTDITTNPAIVEVKIPEQTMGLNDEAILKSNVTVPPSSVNTNSDINWKSFLPKSFQ